MSRRGRDLRPLTDEERRRLGLGDDLNSQSGMTGTPAVPRGSNTNRATGGSAMGGQFSGMTGTPAPPRTDSIRPAQPTDEEISSAQALRDSINNPTITPSQDQIDNPMGREKPRPAVWDTGTADMTTEQEYEALGGNRMWNALHNYYGASDTPEDISQRENQNDGGARFAPLSHNDLHKGSQDHQDQQQQDGATPFNIHNFSSGEKSSNGGVIAMSNERPTYDGKQNDSHKIIDKVIDALSDAMTQYLLKDKRRFLKSSMSYGDVIPTTLGGSVKEMADNAGFLSAFASNPTNAVFGAGIGALRKGLDATEGTNVFEELGRDRTQKVAEIGMYRGIENFVHTIMGDGQKPVDKVKHYLVAEASGETQGRAKLNRMTLSNTQNEEMIFIKNPVIIPYIILAVVFYKAHHSSTNPLEHRGIMRDYLLKKCLKEVLQGVLGLPLEATTFAIDILSNLPPQLINAYQRNMRGLEGVNPEEVSAINNFAKFIFDDYNKIYKEPFQKAVKSFQGEHIDILFLLNNLDKARVLNDMANQIETADNIIWEAQNNQGLFLGLLELAGTHSRGSGDVRLDTDDVLDNYVVDGIVYYMDTNSSSINNQPTTLKNLMDIERNGGKGMIRGNKNAGIYKNGDDYVLAIKGSELPKDLKANFSNIAGSLGDTDRYKQAEGLLQTALTLADRSGGSVAISGFSLGAKIAMELASHYHSVEADVYDPVISSGMEKLFSTIGDNINFNVVENSPISQNIFKYAKKYNLPVKSYKRKRVSNHSLLNFV